MAERGERLRLGEGWRVAGDQKRPQEVRPWWDLLEDRPCVMAQGWELRGEFLLPRPSLS